MISVFDFTLDFRKILIGLLTCKVQQDYMKIIICIKNSAPFSRCKLKLKVLKYLCFQAIRITKLSFQTQICYSVIVKVILQLLFGKRNFKQPHNYRITTKMEPKTMSRGRLSIRVFCKQTEKIANANIMIFYGFMFHE